MSRKNDVGNPMPIRLQTSHRLMSLPSLIKANYWTLSRTTMTSIGIQIPSPELQEQLRSLCREYIDIFSTSVRSLPAQVTGQ